LGTNDNSFPGGSVGSDNMTKIAETEYDGGSVGNSHATTRTAFVENSTTDRRDTAYAYDYRGRAILVTNPQAPHALMKYDNRGRVTTTAQYSSASGLSASSDPTSVSTNRVARHDTAFDARGRVYKTTRHEINQSTGASSSTLDSKTWYDPVGRTLKVQGMALAKTEYDRIGRTRRTFTLGVTNDSAYSDADDVSGDTVMEEHHTTYDNLTGNVLCRATIWRHPNESTSTYGSLYTGTPGTSYAYGDVDGRISITAMYYDSIDRMVDTVSYGTAGITIATGSWSRAGSAPSRSTTALRTTYSFTDDGLTKDVTDPKALVHRTEYDAARRKITTIANYVNGTPSADTADDDQTIRYGYTNGLMTTMTADLSTDQVTTYTYGVTRGSLPASKLASNRLLQKVAYPDSASGSDVVSYAYNAQGQQYWTKDQAGNEITSYFDTAGRETSRRANAINGSFDDYVQRIDTAYLSRGLVDTITQYDDTSATTARDQVQYLYDGWGNVTNFKQDVDSAIGASGRAVFEVTNTWAASTPSTGPNMLRRTAFTIPAGYHSGTVNIRYGSANSLPDIMSRAEDLYLDSVTIAAYSYLGQSQLVDTDLGEPDASTGVFDASATTYPDWDNFNRITRNDWLRSRSGPYFDTEIFYDENSNITRIEDNLYTIKSSGNHIYDVAYTNDNLNRLANAEQGHWGGSSISGVTNYEAWTLSQTGNWNAYTRDIDKDTAVDLKALTDASDFTDTEDTRSYNLANEYTSTGTIKIGKNTGSPPYDTLSPSFSSAYDDVGNLIDDKVNYKYTYDVFGRLVEVRTQGSALVAEYRYNGLGFRTGWHYDTDGDGTVESASGSDDSQYWYLYDQQWRPIATFRQSDTDPKERFVFHCAGVAGSGSSSYIDAVILRDYDDTYEWNGAGDGSFEQRTYLLQNWRADVVAILDSVGEPLEHVRYSPYGVPSSYPLADVNRDGLVDSDDYDDWDDMFTGAATNAKSPVDLNGDGLFPDTTDYDLFLASYHNSTGMRGGYNKLGATTASSLVISPQNRIGYAGYQWDPAIKQYHVRHRVYNAEVGRWTRRDPLGYVGSLPSLFAYVSLQPIGYTDPSGLVKSGWRCARDSAWIVVDIALLVASINACLAPGAQLACLAGIVFSICALITDLISWNDSCFGNAPPPNMLTAIDVLNSICRAGSFGFGAAPLVIRHLKDILNVASGIAPSPDITPPVGTTCQSGYTWNEDLQACVVVSGDTSPQSQSSSGVTVVAD
ncbi:MAG TPA: RHS repeat-associated core domain-containing protein, partial [Phycisphaerales bacterium]|nr:RHS repeat-associated core domain-containing protein [Phycisphaerales bacterium]